MKLKIDGNHYDTKMYFNELNGKTKIHWNIKEIYRLAKNSVYFSGYTTKFNCNL